MEKANAGEGHRDTVFVASFYHIVIAYGAACLSDKLHTALMGALDIVAEGEEGI